MRVNARLASCLLVPAAVVAGGLPAVAAAPATAPARDLPGAVAAASMAHLSPVTLITGDRLLVATDGSNRVAVTPAEGREHVAFATRTVGGHLYVIPSDVTTLVGTGRLDRRLFDVTTLVNSGYDDRRADLPLIVTYASGTAKPAVRADASTPGAWVVRDLPAAHGFAVRADRRHAAAVFDALTARTAGTAKPARPGATPATAAPAAPQRALKPEIGTIWLDGRRAPSLDVSVPAIGAPQAWQQGYTGAGVEVGVVDTGVDDTHPDLADRIVASQDFTDEADNLDHVGHGTHVASIIAGSGAASNGKYTGVAPGARIDSAKVCVLDGCMESSILAGMQWVAADRHAKVVNMSLGGYNTPEIDPLEQAVADLTAAYGTLFVIAAGNDGRDGSVSSPATADDALAVGAVTKAGDLAEFSSRGPRAGDYGIKPEITAPGVDIVAAAGKDQQIGTPIGPDNRYMALSGTSMATPHVAGSAAILAQRHPDWTGAQLKAALMAAADPNPAIGVYAQGAGRVDVARAIDQTITTTPLTASFGLHEWPHGDDAPATKAITYHNAGDAPVTLDLATHATGPDGAPAPDGMFTVSPARLTVPAGGAAAVTVTVDTSRAAPDGYFGGEVTATAAGARVQTPVAVFREPESHTLTLTHLDRTGAPTDRYGTTLFGLDSFGFWFPYDPGGTVTMRLPKGRYTLASDLFPAPDQPNEITDLVQPVLDLDRDQTVTLDARTGAPVRITLPRTGAAPVIRNAGYTLNLADMGYGFGLALFGPEGGLYTGRVGPDTTVDGFTANISGQWSPGAQWLNNPYLYLLSWYQRGRPFTGLDRTVTDDGLAQVRTAMSAGAAGAQGLLLGFDQMEGAGGGWVAGFTYDLPNAVSRFVNTDNGVRWSSEFMQQVPGGDPEYPFPEMITDHMGAAITYQAGRSYRETWNGAVFGPTLDAGPFGDSMAFRTGDLLGIGVPLYGDGAGRPGYSRIDSAKITVDRNGTRIGEADLTGSMFEVPAEPGRYTVTMAQTRGAPFTLSTSTTVRWTFSSAHVDEKTMAPLPMSVVRFTPALDAGNTLIGAGQVAYVPVQVTGQPGSPAGDPATLAVWVSGDDGTTWRAAPVRQRDGHTVIEVTGVRPGSFVSLRAVATDTAGNTVEQTIIRAYRS